MIAYVIGAIVLTLFVLEIIYRIIKARRNGQ